MLSVVILRTELIQSRRRLSSPLRPPRQRRRSVHISGQHTICPVHYFSLKFIYIYNNWNILNTPFETPMYVCSFSKNLQLTFERNCETVRYRAYIC